MSAVKMIVSHQETSSISSNIRAIIEQLNLNAVENNRRKTLGTKENMMPLSARAPNVSIGVYGWKSSDYQYCSEGKTFSPTVVGRRIEVKPIAPPPVYKKPAKVKTKPEQSRWNVFFRFHFLFFVSFR